MELVLIPLVDRVNLLAGRQEVVQPFLRQLVS